MAIQAVQHPPLSPCLLPKLCLGKPELCHVGCASLCPPAHVGAVPFAALQRYWDHGVLPGVQVPGPRGGWGRHRGAGARPQEGHIQWCQRLRGWGARPHEAALAPGQRAAAHVLFGWAWVPPSPAASLCWGCCLEAGAALLGCAPGAETESCSASPRSSTSVCHRQTSLFFN